jgi:hypothetical protein
MHTLLVPRLCQTNDAMRTEQTLSSVAVRVSGVVMIAVLARSRIRTRAGRDGCKEFGAPELFEVATDRLCNSSSRKGTGG